MSDENKSKVRVAGLCGVLAVAAGIIVWQATRKPAPLPDETADKANRLTQKTAELEDQRRAREAAEPEPTSASGPEDIRGGGTPQD